MCKSNIPRRLHTAGIPCVYDDVVFALDSRFVVGIHSRADIHVNTVRIGYQVNKISFKLKVRNLLKILRFVA